MFVFVCMCVFIHCYNDICRHAVRADIVAVNCGRLILDILNDSRDSVEVALSRDGSWQVTQTADPDLSDDDDDDDEYSYALLPPSEPAAASGTNLSVVCQPPLPLTIDCQLIS